MVKLQLMPDVLAEMAGFNPSVTLPLFVVVLGGIAAGLIIGFFWEWLREHKHRREAGQKSREVHVLKREVSRLRDEKHQGKDEVLAILDEAG